MKKVIMILVATVLIVTSCTNKRDFESEIKANIEVAGDGIVIVESVNNISFLNDSMLNCEITASSPFFTLMGLDIIIWETEITFNSDTITNKKTLVTYTIKDGKKIEIDL